MKKQIFLTALIALIGMSNVVLAQKPQQHSAPARGEALYVETTKYLPYMPAKGYEDKQIRYDPANRMWLTFTSQDSNTVEAWIYDYDPAGNMTMKANILMHQGVPERHGYYVYKFSYVTYTYDKANRLITTVSRYASEELFGECIQKIADRLGWVQLKKNK